ncbi:MAG: glycosyltransferase family 2 protein [Candidatus Dormibacteraeota bacterium]|nr:glycosyltransferase family 2 protein [Candidatus Dormibacteraeota bacterium]
MILPIVGMVRGALAIAAGERPADVVGWIGTALSFLALLLGTAFFAYSIRYYLATILVLATTGAERRNGEAGNGNGTGNGHGNGLSRIAHRARGGNGVDEENGELERGDEPFVSIHIATYNEKRVLERLLEACEQLDYDRYEVVLVDDSTDETLDILDRWDGRPRFKIAHRPNRDGFKGGALQQALGMMDPRADFVLVFDADAVPFADSLQRFLPHFYKRRQAGGRPRRREEVAAVQSYQWHVLNKSENWLTAAVRAEYSGSYMVERVYQDDIGAMKMVAGTAYMIRADLLRELGWGRSLTEDWELTLRLYRRGYRVVYTPYAETPAECVSTFARLARQRMRWAEGHMFNVRRNFWPVLRSPYIGPLEKMEFLYFAGYYMQAALLAAGMLAWLISEIWMGQHVPQWTATFGWSLLLTNLLSLPIMNLAGLALEEASRRDLAGVLGAVAVSYLLVPFQAYAAIKGLLESDEGPWFRTPKTGRITDPVHHLRRLRAIRRWLFRGPTGNGNGDGNGHGHGHGDGGDGDGDKGGGGAAHVRRRPSRRAGWVVTAGLVAGLAALGVQATHVPVAEAATAIFYMHSGGFMDSTAPAGSSTQTGNLTGSGSTLAWVSSSGSTGPAPFSTSDVFVFNYTGTGTATSALLKESYAATQGGACGGTQIISWSTPLVTTAGQHQSSSGSPSSNITAPTGSFFCFQVTQTSTGSYQIGYDSTSAPTNLTDTQTSGTTLYLHSGSTLNTTAPISSSATTSTFSGPGSFFLWSTSGATSAPQTIHSTDAFVFTYYGSGAQSLNATVGFGYGTSFGCSGGTTSIFTSSQTLSNSAGAHQTSSMFPSSNVVVPTGSFFCFSITENSGNGFTLNYDSTAQPTALNSADVIFIPERLLALLALGVIGYPALRRLRRS